MIEVDCRLYDGKSAASASTTLRFHGDGSVVRGEPSPCSVHVDQLAFSERLGRIPRRITFPDGVVCETEDHGTLDQALRVSRSRAGFSGNWLHALESRWHWAAAALVLSIGFVYAGIVHGVPWLSARVAPTIPYEVRLGLGEKALAAFDRSSSGESALPAERRQALQARFRDLADWAGMPDTARLEFRGAEKFGPNAFAFPGGIVLVTDALVGLAESDDEIVSVLAHEIGHVHHHHGMRQVLQNTGISVVVIAVTGDVSWLATTIPTTLLAASYSREFERQADAYARDYMRHAGIPGPAFVELLRRIAESHGAGAMPEFLSSHPGVDERAEAFR